MLRHRLPHLLGIRTRVIRSELESRILARREIGGMAASLRANEDEGVPRIAIRLKIPSGRRDAVLRDWSAPAERKFFPNDRVEVVTVNLDRLDHPRAIVSSSSPSLPFVPRRHSP